MKKIVVTTNDHSSNYAYLEKDPTCRTRGETPEAAIVRLIVDHPDVFDIEIDTAPVEQAAR